MDLKPVEVIRNLNDNLWLVVEVLVLVAPLISCQDSKQTLTESTQVQPCLQTNFFPPNFSTQTNELACLIALRVSL